MTISSDGGNVSGAGFKVILTAFRSGKVVQYENEHVVKRFSLANKSHPCNPDDDEYLCHQGDCISSLLLCDGVSHCLDGSDESPVHSCRRNVLGFIEDDRILNEQNQRRIRQHQQWRGILIVAFLLIIFLAFLFFMIYLLCRRCFQSTNLFNECMSSSFETID